MVYKTVIANVASQPRICLAPCGCFVVPPRNDKYFLFLAMLRVGVQAPLNRSAQESTLEQAVVSHKAKVFYLDLLYKKSNLKLWQTKDQKKSNAPVICDFIFYKWNRLNCFRRLAMRKRMGNIL